MPRKPVVTLPTDFFETGNVRALCKKKGGEETLIVYLQLYCMRNEVLSALRNEIDHGAARHGPPD